ncbi:TlpA disulfide reductase family protein [Chitinophaga defluvii]|uniref:TlpA disulfide reductase family protein n=1 Tax=Chitinophaga defluvii TaxID=3163343 RepID=A0ABV2TA58_9BACT
MKTLIAGTALLLASLSSTAQQQVVLKGTVTGDLKGNNKMYFYTRTMNDSAIIENGQYTYSFTFEEPVNIMLLPEYVKTQRMMYVPFGILFDQPATYTITTDIEKGMESSVVKGTETVELLGAYDKQKKAAWKKISEALSTEFGQPWMQEDNPRYPEFEKRQQALQQQYLVPVLEKLVKEHPGSYAAAYTLQSDGRSALTTAQQERMYGMLSKKMQASKSGKDFYNYIQGVKNSAVGKKIKDFTLPDPQDQNFTFSSLKGKYILIDFWASWCAPCRQSFPRMREVYSAYKDKNFEILSISIDQSKPDWLKAVKQENNPWPQVLDNKSISASGFAITGVPTTFLIGPDGKIVMKEVGFDPNGNGTMEQKLAAIFGSAVPVKEEKATKQPDTPKQGEAVKAIPMTLMQ